MEAKPVTFFSPPSKLFDLMAGGFHYDTTSLIISSSADVPEAESLESVANNEIFSPKISSNSPEKFFVVIGVLISVSVCLLEVDGVLV